MARGSSLFVAASVVAAASCLPQDTRPEPATVNVTVTGSPLVDAGIPAASVDDGWSIDFDRVLVSVGNSSIEGSSCTDYEETDYRRLYDVSVVAPQKLAVIYGLGDCGFVFRVNNANSDSIEEQGVTDDEKTTMITPGGDLYTSGPTGISFWVRGNATNGTETKTFDWQFRLRRVAYHDCALPDGSVFGLTLEGGQTFGVNIEIHPEVLFDDRLDVTTAHLRFAPFAAADDVYGDGDGAITLDELGAESLDQAGVTAADDTLDGYDYTSFTTFEDFVYLGLFPSIARVTGTTHCLVDVNVSGH